MVIASVALVTLSLSAPATLHGASEARRRPGPVTVRGTVLQMFKAGFTFDSPSKGVFDVQVSKLTGYWEAGVRIKPSAVQVGTHVGVRGYLKGRTLRAIKVTVYKTKGGSTPRGSTIRHAVVGSVGRTWIEVSYAKQHWRFVVNARTIVKERNRPGSVTSAKPGQLAHIRYYHSGGRLTALRVTLLVIHVRQPKSHFEHGTVWRLFRGGFTLETIAGHALSVSYRHAVSVGEIVSVRGYEQKGRFIALSVRRIKKLPVKTHVIRGTIARIQGTALRVRESKQTVIFQLQKATKIEVGLHVKSVRSLRSGQYVYVRFWWQGKSRIATTVHVYSSKSVKTHVIRGTIARVRGAALTLRQSKQTVIFQLQQATKIEVGLHVKSVRSLRSGQYVYVRFWWQGKSRIAKTVHVYSSKSGHRKTGKVRGILVSLRQGVVVVRAAGRSVSVQVPAAAHIREGSKPASASALQAGQDISVHYFFSGSTRIATSIHIYASGGKGHTVTGTIVRVQKGRVELLDRGRIRILYVSHSTVVSHNGQSVSEKALELGERIKVTGPEDHQGRLRAGMIDILPPTSRGSGAFSGSITRLHRGKLTIRLSVGPVITTQLTRKTRVTARSRGIPQGWLFAGPAVTTYVLPQNDGTPLATTVDFRPKNHSVTGNVEEQVKGRIEVSERSNLSAWCDLRVARVTDSNGRKVNQIGLGSHVKVTGFLLPWGREAAMTVTVSHPTERLSGTVVSVHGQSLEVRRSFGQQVTLRFPKGVQAWSSKTRQNFAPSAIPVKSHLSVRGVAQAGWILVSSATVTLRSEYVGGIAAKLGKSWLLLQESAKLAVKVHINGATKVEVGRLVVAYADVEVGDTVTVHAYPDASGGLLAHILAIHRKLMSRTGDISNLSPGSFDLVLRDGTALHFLVYPNTKVTENGLTIPYADLVNGDHCHVEGHLRPDGSLDATRIDLK